MEHNGLYTPHTMNIKLFPKYNRKWILSGHNGDRMCNVNTRERAREREKSWDVSHLANKTQLHIALYSGAGYYQLIDDKIDFTNISGRECVTVILLLVYLILHMIITCAMHVMNTHTH